MEKMQPFIEICHVPICYQSIWLERPDSSFKGLLVLRVANV
jgi:hypothetical protein